MMKKNSNLTRTKSYANFRVLLIIIDNNKSKIDNSIRTITERNLKKTLRKCGHLSRTCMTMNIEEFLNDLFKLLFTALKVLNA